MKFSFKKRGGDKDAKAAKRVARAGGQDGVTAAKTFLLNHLEKLLLTTIAILALLIIYSGWKKDRLQSGPDDLRLATQNARSRIDESTWAEVRQQRQPEADTFNQRATADAVAINDENFPLPMPFHPILKERQKRRADPQFMAPIDLEVSAGYGALAIRPSDSAGTGRMSELFRSSGSSEETRPLPAKYTERRPGEVLTGASPTESAFFVSVTGLVPIQQQFEAYREAFEGAAEYLAERDTPNYLALNVQRAQVGADGQPGEWTDLNALRVMRLEPTRWEGQVEERASSDHIVKSLVMPLPPIKFRNVSKWALHSKIPEQRMGSDFSREPTRTAPTPASPASDGAIDLFGGVGSQTEGRPSDVSSATESSTISTADDTAFANQPKIDFGLLRYFDFTVEPGTVYVYRTQLILEDPNNPRESARPSTAACETTVVVRRQTNPKKNWIETPWSEPSRPVAVPTGSMVLAGNVEQPRTAAVTVGNRRIRLTRRPGDEPDADVMAVVWDRDKAMDVPAKLRVRRGSVINGVVTTEAINPSQSNIVKLQDYSLETNALVLDIAGGEFLDSAGKLRAPGMILLMTGEGQLVFHHQVADYDQFDYYSIPEDEDLAIDRERDRAIESEAEPDRRRGRGRDGQPPVEGQDNGRGRR